MFNGLFCQLLTNKSKPDDAEEEINKVDERAISHIKDSTTYKMKWGTCESDYTDCHVLVDFEYLSAGEPPWKSFTVSSKP